MTFALTELLRWSRALHQRFGYESDGGFARMYGIKDNSKDERKKDWLEERSNYKDNRDRDKNGESQEKDNPYSTSGDVIIAERQ